MQTSSAPVVVRLAGPDDAALLASMLNDFAAYEQLPSNSTQESVFAELTAEDGILNAMIAFVGERPVGCATFFQTYSTFAARRGLYLEDLYVAEGYRNIGVGTSLLKFLAKHAVDRKFGRVEFNVLLWNNVAIEFFEGLGAKPNSAWTTYRLTGEWLDKLAADS